MRERIFQSAGKREEKKRNSIHNTKKTFSNSKNYPIDKLLFLQRAIGNKTLQRLSRSETSCEDLRKNHSHRIRSAPTFFIDEGRKGSAPTYLEEFSTERKSPMLNLEPRLFINHGRLSTSRYWITGGRGGSGLQNVGAINTRPPIIVTRTQPSGQPVACVQRRTGIAQVFRGYYGVQTGDQNVDGSGNRWFITALAAQRINLHEEEHIAESRRIHNDIIIPTEGLVRQYECGTRDFLPPAHISTEAGAISELESIIDWGATIQSFRDQDRARNRRGGTLDAQFQSAPDAPQLCDRPVVVNGIVFQRYLHLPSETCPPSPSP